MAIFVMKLKGSTGLIEIGATSMDEIMSALGGSQQYVETLELSPYGDEQAVTDYFNHGTDCPFAHLPFHEQELAGFIDQLYHARHLCFLADDEVEAKAWAKEYEDRGALKVTYAKAFPEMAGTKEGEMYNVVIKVFPPEAEQQVGYTPEHEEWLGVDPEFDECHAATVYTAESVARQRVEEKRKQRGL